MEGNRSRQALLRSRRHPQVQVEECLQCQIFRPTTAVKLLLAPGTKMPRREQARDQEASIRTEVKGQAPSVDSASMKEIKVHLATISWFKDLKEVHK